jgi:hypothetical protein
MSTMRQKKHEAFRVQREYLLNLIYHGGCCGAVRFNYRFRFLWATFPEFFFGHSCRFSFSFVLAKWLSCELSNMSQEVVRKFKARGGHDLSE